MSIKSDKWITKMSLEKKMIEPFSENQMRIENLDIPKSFGKKFF